LVIGIFQEGKIIISFIKIYKLHHIAVMYCCNYRITFQNGIVTTALYHNVSQCIVVKLCTLAQPYLIHWLSVHESPQESHIITLLIRTWLWEMN